MATMTYEAVLRGNGNLPTVNFSQDRPPIKSIGFQFLLHCQHNNLSPRFDMPRIVSDFHALLLRRRWIWDPSTAGNGYIAGARLLDGTVNRGECAYVPYALAYLVNAPAPWGFGDGGATVESFSGPFRDGFISRHANALAGPTPNIVTPQGAELAGYYLWGNHKVVRYGGRFYDVCYNADRASLAAMSVGSLQLMRRRARLRDLRDYNPTGGWTPPMRLFGLKLADLWYRNAHDIDVYRATGSDARVQGYYLGWAQSWGWLAGAGSATWYGPYAQSPLAR